MLSLETISKNPEIIHTTKDINILLPSIAEMEICNGDFDKIIINDYIKWILNYINHNPSTHYSQEILEFLNIYKFYNFEEIKRDFFRLEELVKIIKITNCKVILNQHDYDNFDIFIRESCKRITRRYKDDIYILFENIKIDDVIVKLISSEFITSELVINLLIRNNINIQYSNINLIELVCSNNNLVNYHKSFIEIINLLEQNNYLVSRQCLDSILTLQNSNLSSIKHILNYRFKITSNDLLNVFEKRHNLFAKSSINDIIELFIFNGYELTYSDILSAAEFGIELSCINNTTIEPDYAVYLKILKSRKYYNPRYYNYKFAASENMEILLNSTTIYVGDIKKFYDKYPDYILTDDDMSKICEKQITRKILDIFLEKGGNINFQCVKNIIISNTKSKSLFLYIIELYENKYEINKLK